MKHQPVVISWEDLRDIIEDEVIEEIRKDHVEIPKDSFFVVTWPEFVGPGPTFNSDAYYRLCKTITEAIDDAKFIMSRDSQRYDFSIHFYGCYDGIPESETPGNEEESED